MDNLSKKQKEKAVALAKALEKLYPGAQCTLEWHEPWQLLVMGRLSAQCTDARVNAVCRDLFVKYPTADSIADADIHELEEAVKPCGLYRTKAASLKAACTMLRDDFGGKLPDTIDELLSLPGVGRKIANLLLGDVYGIPGIVADTLEPVVKETCFVAVRNRIRPSCRFRGRCGSPRRNRRLL